MLYLMKKKKALKYIHLDLYENYFIIVFQQQQK
jgi:hypothetical protein